MTLLSRAIVMTFHRKKKSMIIRKPTDDIIPDKRRVLINWFLNNFTVKYLFGGSWANTYPWFVPRRNLMDTFFLLPSSPVEISTDTETRVITKGEFFLLPEGQWHSYSPPGNTKLCKHVILHALFLSPFHPNPTTLFPSPFHKLKNYMQWHDRAERIVTLETQDKPAAVALANAVITELMVELIQTGPEIISSAPSISEPRVQQAILQIEKDYAKNLSVEALAADAGLQPVRFRSLFKQHTGKSPKQFLNDTRLQKAVEMLLSSSATVTTIAFECGFNDENYFRNFFRLKTGLTPTAYRMQNRR